MEQTKEKVVPESDFTGSPLLSIQSANGDSELKDFIIEFTGNKLSPENNEVNINMISEVLAAEFPEFAFAFAEENFIRGYQLGLEDASRLLEEETTETKRKE